MVQLKEARKLLKVDCYYNVGMNCYVFRFNGKSITVRNIEDAALAKIFQIAQMKDEETEPASLRGKTYLEMVQSIKDGTDKHNYIWSNYEGVFIDALLKHNELQQEKHKA